MLVIPFRITIPEERQDRQLAERLLAEEASGIFNWAIVGLRRLLEVQRFTASDVSVATVEEFKKDDNPIRVFAQERLSSDSEGLLPKSEVFQNYIAWAEARNEKAIPQRQFGRSLKRVIPTVQDTTMRIGGQVRDAYRGIAWCR